LAFTVSIRRLSPVQLFVIQFTVNAICSLSKEQKELIDKFGTSKEQMSSLDGVYGIK